MADVPDKLTGEVDEGRGFKRTPPADIAAPVPGQASVGDYPRPPRGEPVQNKIKKVFCYVVKTVRGTRELLVFRSLDEPGFEVPKGSVERGETLEQAALREVFEEAGISSVHLVKELGSTDYYDEEQHFLLLQAFNDLPQAFTHAVTGEGIDAGFHYDFQWFSLNPALHELLVQGCDRFVGALLEELHDAA
jgi:8-oxo-dGTP diphosphatase